MPDLPQRAVPRRRGIVARYDVPDGSGMAPMVAALGKRGRPTFSINQDRSRLRDEPAMMPTPCYYRAMLPNRAAERQQLFAGEAQSVR
jgi:hypothetical protein